MKHYTEDQLDVVHLNLIGIISIPLKQKLMKTSMKGILRLFP